MRGKKFSIGLRALAIFAVTLLVTSTWAATNWKEKVLLNFSGTDGSNPVVGLIFDAAGNLYGTTGRGGAYGYGTVFELTPNGSGGWTETVLYNFCSQTNCTDGAIPSASLILDAAGNLYGTTWAGGTGSATFCTAPGPNCGTVFELTPSGEETVLYNFCSQTNCTDGANPSASLIFDGAGNLYGTTQNGGTYSSGTVFGLTPIGGGNWAETVIHSFCSEANCADGMYPWAGLIFDATGNLYGTTYLGGTYGAGTLFELSPNGSGGWTETVLHNFGNYGTDGEFPHFGVLIFDAAGNLYGTTYLGGTYDGGTVFELTPTGGGRWTEAVLYSFGNGTDGAQPLAGLIIDAAGNLYGTTGGGTNGDGTVFELTPAGGGAWMEQVLHDFGNGTDGVGPDGSLIFDAEGNLYSTTGYGGTYGDGTVFELTPILTHVYPCAVCGHGALQ